MLPALGAETVDRVASYLDTTQVYRLHHASRDSFHAFHGRIMRWERVRREWEVQEMRHSESDRWCWYPWPPPSDDLTSRSDDSYDEP